MRKATTRIIAGALSAALVLTGAGMPNKSASAASAKLNKDRVVLYVGGNNTTTIKAKNVDSVKFKSKDESVAKVNKKTGKVTAKGAGKTKVIAKTDAGKLKCTVRVYKAIKTLTTDTAEVNLAPGETQTVSVGVKPAAAQQKMWKVTTSDTTVATKTKANGKKGTFDINAVAEGTATITVSSTDGGSAPDATIKVNVVEAAQDADEDTTGADTDENEDLSGAKIVVEADSALTNAAQTEMYVFYATYDADGNKIDNPTMGWIVSGEAEDSSLITYGSSDRSDLGILVVEAPSGGTLNKGDIVNVYGTCKNNGLIVDKNIEVGDVRAITSVEFAGIVETYTDADGSAIETFLGDTLPFGFENNNKKYELALNAYDQNGNTMINMDAYAWDEVNTDNYIFGDALTADGEWDLGDTPAMISSGWTVSNKMIDGVYYDCALIEGTEVSSLGGTGIFYVTNTAWWPQWSFEYTVGSAAELESLELVAPTTRIKDGDSATIGVNGIFTDGTVYENIPVEKLKEQLGATVVNSISVKASADRSNVEECTWDVTGDTAVVTWTDIKSLDDGSNPVYDTYSFDGEARTVSVGLENCPIPVSEVTLSVEDPSRPVDVKLADETTDWSKAFYVNGCDSEIVFIDQYGEEISNNWCDGAMAGFWTANDSGYSIEGSLVYFGVCLFENGNGELIGTYDSSLEGCKGGVKFEVAEDAAYEKASIGIVSYQGQVGDGDLSEIGAGYWSPVGDTAYVKTVSRTVTYTFTPSSMDIDMTLTYYDETNAANKELDGAGWYFSGTITGTVSEYINGTQNTDFNAYDVTYAANNDLVEVSLSCDGEEVFVGEDSVNDKSYTATITLTGSTVEGYEDAVVAEWSVTVSATATGTAGTKVENLTYKIISL